MKDTIIIFTIYLNAFPYYPSFVHSHAKAFADKGYNVVVFAQKSVLPIFHIFKKEEKHVIDNVKVIIGNRLSISGLFPNSPINVNGIFYYLSINKKVKEIINNNNAILFDAHTFQSPGYAAYLLKKKYPNIKATVTFHGSDLETLLASKNQTKRLIKSSKYIDSFVAVSDKLTNKVKHIGIDNIKTIYNGINNFKLSKEKKEKLFISCGSLIESKNFELLIDSFGEFHKNNKDYKLKIIGSGPLKKKLEQKIVQLKLDKHVILTGELTNQDVYKEFEKAYAFFLISRPEGFGIVYPESMYCGCVAVGTKNEGIDGFIKNNKNGFLVNPTIKEIVDIMKYITAHDCNKISKQGQEDSKKLTWSKNCNQYLSLK